MVKKWVLRVIYLPHATAITISEGKYFFSQSIKGCQLDIRGRVDIPERELSKSLGLVCQLVFDGQPATGIRDRSLNTAGGGEWVFVGESENVSTT